MGRSLNGLLQAEFDQERRFGFLRSFSMALRELRAKANTWLKVHRQAKAADDMPEIDSEGLISCESEPSQSGHAGGDNHVVLKPVQQMDKQQSLEKLQDGFNRLIDQLEGINDNLGRQVAQHEDLMSRVNKMPQLLESFPEAVENHNKLTEQLLEQLKTTAGKEQQFTEIVSKIPAETAKQTDALVNIDHQLAAAADTDVQMTEGFNNFNETLGKLNRSITGQTDGIMQMSRTFAASDRYLKYVMSRQHKRFMWMLMTTVGVCATVILALGGIILYLAQ